MNEVDAILKKIMGSAHENEVIEFKDRKNLSKDELGKYFSALSNEANLKNQSAAWIIFGIDDSGTITNSNYLSSQESQNEIKRYISEQSSGHLSFKEIFTRYVEGKRLLLFEVPPASFGTPTSFKGFAYERQGDSLLPLSEFKRLKIMEESFPDWSKQIIPDVGIEILDPEAISLARAYYIRNRPEKESECKTWDDRTFLNKARLTINNQITYAALVLLGRPETAHLIPEANLCLRWILRDNENQMIDHDTFTLPFVLSIEKLCSKIRNVKYEYFRPSTLVPDRMDTYDQKMLREALNNCIAHQDYRMCEYITVIEYDRDRLVFSNAGSFIPGSIEAVLTADAPTSFYRNRFLAEAMSNLGLVDVAGSGIIRMFKSQQLRFFPMPEYDLSDNHVKVTITGKVMDEGFAEILMKNPRLSLHDTVLLDRVQKGRPISDSDAHSLRIRGFIEGRKPNYTVASALISDAKSETIKGNVIKRKGLDDQFYCELMVSYLHSFNSASKKEFMTLLFEKLPGSLTDSQKTNKVGNLIAKLKREGIIENIGSTRLPRYVLIIRSE